MKKENRFEVVFSDGSTLKYEGKRQILVDTETGVNYLIWSCADGGGITPLLGADGKPVITKWPESTGG